MPKIITLLRPSYWHLLKDRLNRKWLVTWFTKLIPVSLDPSLLRPLQEKKYNVFLVWRATPSWVILFHRDPQYQYCFSRVASPQKAVRHPGLSLTLSVRTPTIELPEVWADILFSFSLLVRLHVGIPFSCSELVLLQNRTILLRASLSLRGLPEMTMVIMKMIVIK